MVVSGAGRSNPWAYQPRPDARHFAELCTEVKTSGSSLQNRLRGLVLKPPKGGFAFLQPAILMAGLHSRRQALSFIMDKKVTDKVFTELAPKYAERNGGYTRITKLASRLGDGAPMAKLELIE